MRCFGPLMARSLGLGGTNVQADEILVSSESLVPDVILGRFAMDALGSERPTVGLPPKVGEFGIVPEVAVEDVIEFLVLGVQDYLCSFGIPAYG